MTHHAQPPATALRRAVGLVVAGLLLFAAMTGCSSGGTDGSPPSGTGSRELPPATMATSKDGRRGIAVGALPPGTGSPAEVPRGARFVDPSAGDDAGPGTREKPWRTVNHAVDTLGSGSTVVLRGGTYRESVLLRHKTITLMAQPGEQAWFEGSDPVEGFTPDGAGRWRRDGWDPGIARLGSDSHLVSQDNPLAGWPDQLFVDGEPQELVPSVGEVGPGRFFVDPAARQLVVGYDPSSHRIEASTRPWAIYLDDASRSALIGFGVRRYATPSSDLAAVRVHSRDAQVRDLVLQDNAYAGLSVMAPDVTVTQLTARNNGQLGVQARHADGLRFARSLLEGNNTKGFDPSQQAGGIKLTASRHVRIESTLARDNAGQGIWLDQSVLGAELVGNTATANRRNGIMVELAAKVLVAGNLVADNGTNGIYVVESNNIDVVANTVVGNAGRDVWIVDGPRTSSDRSSADHDRRFPIPDPAVTFDVHRVQVAGNILGDAPTGGPHSAAIVGVEDSTGSRSAKDMSVHSDHNAFWRSAATSSDAFSTWAAYPRDVIVSPDLEAHRRATAEDGHSRSRDGGTNPWIEGAGEQIRSRSEKWLTVGGPVADAAARRALGLGPADRPVGVPATVPPLVVPAG